MACAKGKKGHLLSLHNRNNGHSEDRESRAEKDADVLVLDELGRRKGRVGGVTLIVLEVDLELLPSTPPLRLMSSATIWMASFAGVPRVPAHPVLLKTAPILMGSAARVGVATAGSKRRPKETYRAVVPSKDIARFISPPLLDLSTSFEMQTGRIYSRAAETVNDAHILLRTWFDGSNDFCSCQHAFGIYRETLLHTCRLKSNTARGISRLSTAGSCPHFSSPTKRAFDIKNESHDYDEKESAMTLPLGLRPWAGSVYN